MGSDIRTGGDDDADEAAARKYTGHDYGGIWTPPVWHGGHRLMIGHAKVSNARGFDSVFSAAGKHSNPPVTPWHRDFL